MRFGHYHAVWTFVEYSTDIRNAANGTLMAYRVWSVMWTNNDLSSKSLGVTMVTSKDAAAHGGRFIDMGPFNPEGIMDLNK